MWVTVYCDASYRLGKKAGAYWIKSDHTRIIDVAPLSTPHGDNNLAEVEIAAIAIRRAIDAHESCGITGILLVSDSMCVVNYLRFNAKPCNNKPMREIQEKVSLTLKLKNVRIRTKHQRGHTNHKTVGAYINKAVDNLARQTRLKE